MSDGAHLGVGAGRALDTILGGQEQPNEKERQTCEQVRARVMAAPLPGEGEGLWPHVEAGTQVKEGALADTYTLATDCLAHAFVVLAEEKPALLDEQRFYPNDCDVEILRGKPMSPETAMWEAFTARWPEGDDWVGGASGFMVGFAFNVCRFLVEKPPVLNSAIVTVGSGV